MGDPLLDVLTIDEAAEVLRVSPDVVYRLASAGDLPEGRALRVLRLRCDLGLRDAAKVLELTPTDLSSLERGSATLDAASWCRVFVALADEWEQRNPYKPIDLSGGGHG